MDIEKEIQNKKDGLLTFVIRVHNGIISDFNITEYVDVRQYFRLKSISFQELSVTRHIVK